MATFISVHKTAGIQGVIKMTKISVKYKGVIKMTKISLKYEKTYRVSLLRRTFSLWHLLFSRAGRCKPWG